MRLTVRLSALALAAICTASPSLQAQRRAAAPLPPVTLDSTLLAGYAWRNVGPDRGGRSIAVSGVVGRPAEAYFGAAGGGLWKTTDAGETWVPVTDGQIGSASVGAVAVSESDPNVVYIGMGESCIRGNIMPGDGIYRSTDAGKHWTHVGFAGVDAISKIRIHPTNANVVFAAVFGKYSVPSDERGVYKSTDGGKSWRRVLFRDANTAAIDISIDRTDPNVMYASLWEAGRKEWQMSSGGPGSGLFKSTDGGETWKEITRASGLPMGIDGRIGVAVSGANSKRVYALVENEKGGLFRSDDAGASWTMVNDNRSIRQRAFYYTHVFADPRNADVVYVQNTSMFRSTDGGKTTTAIDNGTHGDFHDLWIDPRDTLHLVVGNDGGGAVSVNGGAKWTTENFPTEQFYHVAATAHIPYHLCGSQQDNTTLCVPYNWNLGTFLQRRAPAARADSGGKATADSGAGRAAADSGKRAAADSGRGRTAPDSAKEPPKDLAAGGMGEAYMAGGGEPGYIAPDPNDPDLFYSGTNNGGYLDRYNRRTRSSREVNPYPWFYSGEPSSAIRERWQWTYPIIFSPVDHKTLYVSSQRLWKTMDGGRTWTALSGDLTRHDPRTQGVSGGPITGDMNGPEVYATIFSIGPSKHTTKTIWTGSDDGLVYLTRDGGKSWTNVTPKEMPDFGRVSQIDASAFDDATAYISVRRPLLDDRAPYIFRTTDYGRTWTKIVRGIRADAYVHAVREDSTRRGMLYAATQHGVYLSYNDGADWQPLSLNLPDVPVADLIVQGNDLAIATHGRGFWVLDNVVALRDATPTSLAQGAQLYAAPAGVRSGAGIPIIWRLAHAPKTGRLEILDSAGVVLRTFEPDTAKPDTTRRASGGRRRGAGPFFPVGAGVQQLVWDLRTQSIESFPGMILWGAGTSGPAVPPGRYTARLIADGTTLTTPLVVRRNPQFPDVSDADLRAQYDFSHRVRDKANEANHTIVEIRRVKAQLVDRLAHSADSALARSGEKLRTDASAVEEKIYQVKNQSGQDPLNFPIKVNNRLATLLSMAERGDGAPTNNMPEIFQILSTELKGYTDELSRVWATDLPAVNGELARLKLPRLDPSCAKITEACALTP